MNYYRVARVIIIVNLRKRVRDYRARVSREKLKLAS